MVEIQPKYLTLGEFLAKRLFTIPGYQRAYSWDKKQRSDLFSDIENTFAKGSDAQHFMATVVALRRRQQLIGTDQHLETEIVDGQQRITTLIMLFKSIERALDRSKSAERKIADELVNLLVKPDTNNLLLLQTNHDSSHYFSNYLREGEHPNLEEAKTTADKHILSAMVECEDFVERWRNKAGLPSLVAMLKNRLTFVLHEIDDESAVYTVFEVLNSRGLDVSWLDRLKSVLMGAAFDLTGGKRNLIVELHNVWRDIYACAGLRLGMSTEALRFAATLRSDEPPNRPLGEEDAVEILQSQSRSAKEIVKTAQWLLSVTRACDKIRDNPRLNAVARIGQARLLATSLHLRSDLRSSERTELLRLWENISFRIYGLNGYDARTAVGDYVRLSWKISNERLPANEIARALKRLGAQYPVAEAVEELRNVDCYSDWQEDLRYFLFRREEYLAQQKGQAFTNEQWERIWLASPSDSIEHIWAQSKAPEKQVHRLGNLVLLPPKLNSKLGNLSPSEKREEYTRTGLLIAQEVSRLLRNPWNRPAIDRREKVLLKWARHEWAD